MQKLLLLSLCFLGLQLNLSAQSFKKFLENFPPLSLNQTFTPEKVAESKKLDYKTAHKFLDRAFATNYYPIGQAPLKDGAVLLVFSMTDNVADLGDDGSQNFHYQILNKKGKSLIADVYETTYLGGEEDGNSLRIQSLSDGGYKLYYEVHSSVGNKKIKMTRGISAQGQLSDPGYGHD